jgi:FAD/FMN-containing dehydrogenase
MSRASELLPALTAIVGDAGIRRAEALAALSPGSDPRNLDCGLMVRPASTAEVSRTLALCDEERVGVVPQGGRTGLAGGASSRPGQIILSLERMNRIESVDAAGRTALVEAGVTLEMLNEAAGARGLAVGVDLAARGSATIGGMVATNAGGMEAFRYGTMRERVLGLEAVLADGAVLAELTRVRKDNSGYPVRQLFIGSEGTLGVVTRVVLSLVPVDGPRAAALVAVPDLDAAVAVLRALEKAPGITLVAAEVMSRNHLAPTASALGLARLVPSASSAFSVLLSVSAATESAAAEFLAQVLGEASESRLVDDALAPKNESELRDLWRIREDWAVDRLRPGGLWYDISVPVDRLRFFADRLAARIRAHDPTLDVVLIGHLADGNLHVTVNAERPVTERYDEIAPLVYADLAGIGGSFSAEHGIGLEKRATLARLAGPVKLGLMQRIKAAFDPHGILNPGKVLESD